MNLMMNLIMNLAMGLIPFFKIKKFTLFCRPYIKKMSNLTKINKIEMKFNKWSNDLNIELIEETNGTISYTKDYINNGENLKIKPIDSNLKNKYIAYCLELLFGILSFSRYVNIEAINIISSDIEINEYKQLGVK